MSSLKYIDRSKKGIQSPRTLPLDPPLGIYIHISPLIKQFQCTNNKYIRFNRYYSFSTVRQWTNDHKPNSTYLRKHGNIGTNKNKLRWSYRRNTDDRVVNFLLLSPCLYNSSFDLRCIMEIHFSLFIFAFSVLKRGLHPKWHCCDQIACWHGLSRHTLYNFTMSLESQR